MNAGCRVAINLHENCLKKLRESLAEKLGDVEINYGSFLAPGTYGSFEEMDSIVPSNGRVRDDLHSYIGEFPFASFVAGFLSLELNDKLAFDGNSEHRKLTNVPEYENCAAVSDRLVKEFESLPWAYNFSFRLPVSFSRIFCEYVKDFNLSDDVFIRSGNSMGDEFPLVSEIELRDKSIASNYGRIDLFTPVKPEWEIDRAYLCVRVYGFVGKYIHSEPVVRAIDAMRAFYGLCCAERLMRSGNGYVSMSSRERYLTHRFENGEWRVEDFGSIEERHADAIGDLILDDLGGRTANDEDFARRMKNELKSIGVAYRSGDRARNVMLGAQWLFDVLCGTDELLQFVQAAVVMEILLGDKASSDQTGLGELLANRCAYLVADSHTQRREILEMFRKIYEVRSKIVHRGKSRLNNAERELFATLRWLCFRVIQEEVKLLEKDGRQ